MVTCNAQWRRRRSGCSVSIWPTFMQSMHLLALPSRHYHHFHYLERVLYRESKAVFPQERLNFMEIGIWTERECALRSVNLSVPYLRQLQNLNKANCKVHHTGSSQSLVPVVARLIWCRSVENRRLCYTTFIGDEDSKSFTKCDLNLYNDTSVRKEECLAHVSKRFKKMLCLVKKNTKTTLTFSLN